MLRSCGRKCKYVLFRKWWCGEIMNYTEYCKVFFSTANTFSVLKVICIAILNFQYWNWVVKVAVSKHEEWKVKLCRYRIDSCGFLIFVNFVIWVIGKVVSTFRKISTKAWKIIGTTRTTSRILKFNLKSQNIWSTIFYYCLESCIKPVSYTHLTLPTIYSV